MRSTVRCAASLPRWRTRAISEPFYPSLPGAHSPSAVSLQERGTRAGSSPLRVLERSIFSDRMVFVRAMHEAGAMEDWELELYDSW